MKTVNRSLAIIKVKKPYVDWANSLPDPVPGGISEAELSGTAFLIPSFDSPEQTIRWFKKGKRPISPTGEMGRLL